MKTQGLAFKKFDLHIHTPASKCYPRKDTPESIVNKCIEKELKAIAITDHNTGESVDLIKTEAKKVNLVVFPGVEITVGDAHIHIIAILDVDKKTRDIEDLLTSLGITRDNFGEQNAFSNKTVNEVINIISDPPFNGLAVLAHIDSTNGVFDHMSGAPRIEVIQHPKLLAAEAIDYPKVSKLLNGSDPAYKRRLAIYHASDNPYLDEKGKPIINGPNSGKHCINSIGYKHTYFKVDDKITIESLRQCFIDPEVRIRQSFEYKDNKYPFIKKVEVNSGFLAGIEFPFHQGLNSILGAKGTGKSLLIEFIRFALDQESSNSDINQDHQNKLKERLGQYGQVKITLSDVTGKEYEITRTYNPSEDNPIECIDIAANTSIDVNIEQLFPVLFLSQTEIIKIAEDQDEQMTFIDKFFDFHTYRNKIVKIENELEILDKKFCDALKAYHDEKELSKQQQTALIELKRLTEQLNNPIFDQYAKLETRDKVLRMFQDYISRLTDEYNNIEARIKYIDIPEIPKDLRTDPSLLRMKDFAKEALTSILDSLGEQRENLHLIFNKAIKEYKSTKTSFDSTKNIYQEKVIKLGGDYQKIEFKRKSKVKEIEDIEKNILTAKNTAKNIKEYSDNRVSKLNELKNVYGNYYQARKERCEYFESISNGKLHILIQESTNKDVFKKNLIEFKKGTYLREPEIEHICDKITPDEFILNILRYDIAKLDETKDSNQFIDAIAKLTEISSDKIKTLADHLLGSKSYDELLLLQYKAYPQDRPEIMYNIEENQNVNFIPLKNLSTGQKCTAMLILSLSEGTLPIIIDQPEDSLDLRAIWDDMCTKLRSSKDLRQFIFTTHNSSVAVASDTDKFIIMTASATKGDVMFSGAIDNEEVRKEVIKYLEGGTKTYKLKFDKYNISRKNNG